MATMGVPARGPGRGGLFIGLLVGLVIGGLVLAPRTRAPLLTQINELVEAKATHQASFDKLQQDKEAVQKELDGLKASTDAQQKELDTAKAQLKECQDKSGGDVQKKVADARAKLDEASKHLEDIGL